MRTSSEIAEGKQTMANLKQLRAALAQKQADLDMMDDQLMGMPEMAPEAPIDMATTPEFDLLSEKREELEGEIVEMREGVELISQWEKFKDGPWSEDIKGLLGEIDIEISDIAGGEVAAADALGGMSPAAPTAPPVDMGVPAPAPEATPIEPAPAEIPAAEPVAEAAPLEAPMASKQGARPQVSKKNSYQAPVKKGTSALPDMKKEGSNMANPTAKASNVKEKLAEVQSKREAIRREAQQRVAAAWTIAKTMLPTAPAEVQKSAASSLLNNSTRILNAMLRQTAKNAHYSKLAETFKAVHKVELNDHLENPSVLSALKSEVAKEIAGDAKNASTEKTADDRKDAGPQTETYNDGRGCGGGKHTEPKPMDAGTSASQTEGDNRPANTVNKSEGDGEGKEKSAAATKKADKCECKGECHCGAKEAAAKTAKHGKDCNCKECKAKNASVKTADEPVMDAPVEEMAPEAPVAEAPIEEAPMDEAAPEAPAEMPMDEGAEGDTAAEVLSDEKKMVVEEKIEEAQEAIKSLEQEILQEGEEELNLESMGEEIGAEGEKELDLAKVFNEGEMEDKVSALANEGDEHTAGNGEEYFAPSAAESMEASLDDTQVASMEDFFSLRGSDSDPLLALIAGDIRTAAEVAGMDVVPSFTGEAAKHFESETSDADNRDNENDHEGDLFAEAIEDQHAEDGGFKRVKQDETNVLQAPKSSSKTASAAAPAKEKTAAPVIKKLKNVTASTPKSVDIASALLGDDEF
jgi:hypothetical protein